VVGDGNDWFPVAGSVGGAVVVVSSSAGVAGRVGGDVVAGAVVVAAGGVVVVVVSGTVVVVVVVVVVVGGGVQSVSVADTSLVSSPADAVTVTVESLSIAPVNVSVPPAATTTGSLSTPLMETTTFTSMSDNVLSTVAEYEPVPSAEQAVETESDGPNTWICTQPSRVSLSDSAVWPVLDAVATTC
jgi:hypothetical protein